MIGLIILIAFLFLVFVFLLRRQKGFAGGSPKSYIYQSKKFFMTRAEHDFFDALSKAVGEEFQIFAQVHLPTIVDVKAKGQSWRGAWAHINRKSVDFVLCDKAYLSPKLVIELDDKTHVRPDRIERDVEVERILADAQLPLLRIENHGSFDPVLLALQVKGALQAR